MPRATIGILYQPLGNPSPRNPYRQEIERMIGAAQRCGRSVVLMTPATIVTGALPAGDYQHWRCPAPFQQTRDVVEWFHDQYRGVTMERLFAPQESTVTAAAECRAAAQIPGMLPEVAERFRHKQIMTAAACAAGVPTARCHSLTTFGAALDFAREVGWPLIIKPVDSAGADGVMKIASAAALQQIWSELMTASTVWRAEEFIPGAEYHADSLVQGGCIVFTRLSRYVRPLMDFRIAPPGSVIRRHDLTAAEYAMIAANARIIRNFGLHDGVTHIEFYDRDGTAIFGEAAARVGGGHAVPTIEAATGINLFDAVVRLELDPDFRPTPVRDREVGGQLLPAPSSGVITHITDPDALLRAGSFDVAYWYEVGDYLARAERSTRMFGRVLADGGRFDEIAASLAAALARFAVTTEEPTEDRAARWVETPQGMATQTT